VKSESEEDSDDEPKKVKGKAVVAPAKKATHPAAKDSEDESDSEPQIVAKGKGTKPTTSPKHAPKPSPKQAAKPSPKLGAATKKPVVKQV
jgi:hypothetical protein